MKHVLLLLLIFEVLLAVFVHGKISDENVKKVSTKCCPFEAFECCTRIIQGSLPLKCDKMTPGTTLKAANCIQKELFPSINSSNENFNIQGNIFDLACCDVFTRNDNDPNNTCFYHCTNSVMTVALKPSERLKKVGSCQLGKNLNSCFNHCLTYLRRHKYRKNFAFSENCLWKNRMVPGKIYVGNNVR